MTRLVILLLALGFGGLTAWLAFDRLPTMMAAQDVQNTGFRTVPMIDVLVAQRDIAAGAPLEPGAMTWQQWPQAAIDATAMITRPEFADAVADLSGSLARSRIIRGEPIQRSKLAAADSGFLAAILPQGKRAVSVRITAENSAGGFILPNDHVDVVFTRARTAPTGTELFARSYTIARNLRVVAINQTVSDDNAEAAMIGETATLEVDPEQAEIITAAQAAGSLTLALRPARDSGALAQDRPVVLADLVARDADTAPADDAGMDNAGMDDATDPDATAVAVASTTPPTPPGAPKTPIRIISKGGIEIITPPLRGES